MSFSAFFSSILKRSNSEKKDKKAAKKGSENKLTVVSDDIQQTSASADSTDITPSTNHRVIGEVENTRTTMTKDLPPPTVTLATHYIPQHTDFEDSDDGEDSYVHVDGEGLVFIPSVPLYKNEGSGHLSTTSEKSRARQMQDVQREQQHFNDVVYRDDFIYKEGKRIKCYSLHKNEQEQLKQSKNLEFSQSTSTDSTILTFMRTNTPAY